MSDKIYNGEHFGRARCEPGGYTRHRHDFGYICVVLSGGFIEAGDSGRFRTGPGDVLVHRPHEAHLDLFGRSSAEVLNLPLPLGLPLYGAIRVKDPDALARLAEKSPSAAARSVADDHTPVNGEADWPDLLAEILRTARPLALGDWARQHGLAPETVSRGFGKIYGTTPQRYRAEARARLAWRALGEARPLAELSFELGFADQAHMTRSLTELTGMPPGRWRRECQLRSIPEPGSRLA